MKKGNGLLLMMVSFVIFAEISTIIGRSGNITPYIYYLLGISLISIIFYLTTDKKILQQEI